MDKSNWLVIAVVALILGIVVLVLGLLRYDLGYDTFYFGLSFLMGVVTAVTIDALGSVKFRIAQKSDNVEVAMAGMGKMLMDLMNQTQRQNSQNMRQMMDEMQLLTPPKPANPWSDDDGDDFGFDTPKPAQRTVEYSNGTGGQNGHR